MHLYQIIVFRCIYQVKLSHLFSEFCLFSRFLSVSSLKLMAPADALGQNMWVKQVHMWYHPVVFGKMILWEACCTKTWPSISHSSGPHNYDDPLCTAVSLENASMHFFWLPSDVLSHPCGVKGQCKSGQNNGQWDSKSICHLQTAQFGPFHMLHVDLLPLISFVSFVISGSPWNTLCFWIIVKAQLRVDGWTSILKWQRTMKEDRFYDRIYQEVIHDPHLTSHWGKKKAHIHCARY